tara:strand:- start:972 stop:1112 length:141 start_codon:yes stop_codon:yes gene_type:complete
LWWLPGVERGSAKRPKINNARKGANILAAGRTPLGALSYSLPALLG